MSTLTKTPEFLFNDGYWLGVTDFQSGRPAKETDTGDGIWADGYLAGYTQAEDGRPISRLGNPYFQLRLVAEPAVPSQPEPKKTSAQDRQPTAEEQARYERFVARSRTFQKSKKPERRDEAARHAYAISRGV